jgi:predicted enzyme related to lactoylglutathione lyase
LLNIHNYEFAVCYSTHLFDFGAQREKSYYIEYYKGNTMAYATLQWIEIEVDDLEVGAEFYEKAVGFATERKFFNDKPMIVLKDKFEHPIGTLVPRESQHLGGITIFFKVPFDISQFLVKVEQYGGSVIEPKKLIKNRTEDGKSVIPKNLIDHNIGYYAVCKDPFGNRFALYSNS